MLSKSEILAKTNKGLEVFRYYLGIDFRVGRNFLNPLYKDTKASCNVYFDRHSGVYKMKDFGNDNFSGDCFFLVGKITGENCNDKQGFVQILKRINDDLHLNLNPYRPRLATARKSTKTITVKNHTPLFKEKKTPYTIEQKPYSQMELDFWSQYGITPTILHKFGVISIKAYHSRNKDNKSFLFETSEVEPIFGYKMRECIKIYRPFSNLRFLYGGLQNKNYCFGLEQLPNKGDTLYITGGEKDVMALYAKGFHAICFNSETSNIPHQIIQNLSYRFKHIVLLYDVDETGIKASGKYHEQLKNFDVKQLILPLKGTKEEKDIADFFGLGKDAKELSKLFLDMLNGIYSTTIAEIKSFEIDLNSPPVMAQSIISINNIPLGTQGNLLCITGGEGTGKSNYVSSFVSGAISANGDADTLGLDILQNKTNKAILLYDTEQSEAQSFKNIQNVLKRARATQKPDSFHSFCLTSKSRKGRLKFIYETMDKFYYEHNGIHLVVIDGIADLIRCANDEAESVAVVDEIYRLAGLYNTCVVCVLHYIPNGIKLRGHLGSELQRKAASILAIEQDDNPAVSVVKAIKVREGSPLDVPLMQFAWSKEQAMHTYIGEKPNKTKDKRKEDELKSVAKKIFASQKYHTYKELCRNLENFMDVKERTAKSYIKFMRDKEIIVKDPANENYYQMGLK